MGFGRTAWGLVRLLRPLNCLLAALGVLAGMGLAGIPLAMLAMSPSRPVSLAALLGAPLAAAFITGFGNVLNDLRDVQVDRTAHPERALPSGRASRRAATNLATALLSIGLASAALAGPLPLLAALAIVGILAFYELRLKRIGLPGNAAVAFLSAATFLFGALATGRPFDAWGLAWVAAAMAYFLSLAREVVKDAQDVDADRGHRDTFPMQVGTVRAGFVAAAAGLVAVAASWPFGQWSFFCDGRAVVPVVLIGIGDAASLAAAALSARHPALAQRSYKGAMACALAGFLLLGWNVLPCDPPAF